VSSAPDTVVTVTAERLRTGTVGEDAAASWYRERGYRELARNWRCSIGEIDLVLGRGDTLIICEVKARRGSGFGAGWEAVTARKRQKLRALAQTFLLVHRLSPRTVRFDVASVVVGSARPRGSRPGAGGSAQVEVFEDAF
jgi:putative endonuclease